MKSDKGGGAGGSRARPTNNQLLYKAYFRWEHENLAIPDHSPLPIDTDACPSVTSCFLQVLQALHQAEDMRTVGKRRNILQILSTNTRRTKVVELSSGTHRVPEELKKHYLSDGQNGQYSTNLDRNRYGNDDNYLFTVIRYDLEFLGFCPCMVDVEIVDAKAGNAATVVQSGLDACTCNNRAEHVANAKTMGAARSVADAQITAPGSKAQASHAVAAAPTAATGAAAPAGPKSQATAGRKPGSRSGRGAESPMRSNSGVSGLFDALVMAATGEAEGAAAAGGGGDANATSAYGGRDVLAGPDDADLLAIEAGGFGAAATGSRFPKPGTAGPVRMRPPPQRSRSRLWSALSVGELDSLQNALEAYVKEEEIVSKPYSGLSDALIPPGAPGVEPMARARRRKPPRGNSSFLLRAADSAGGFSSLSQLGISLGFKETMDDNLAGVTVPREDFDEGNDKGEGGEDCDDVAQLSGRRNRPVPRQFSSVNIASRSSLQAPEVKKLTSEVEALKAENQQLRDALLKQPRSGGNDPTILFTLEQDLCEARSELAALMQRCQALEAKEQVANERARVAEERGTQLSMDLAKKSAEVNILMSKLVGGSSLAASLPGSSPAAMAIALQSQVGASNGKAAAASFDPNAFSVQMSMLRQQAAAGKEGPSGGSISAGAGAGSRAMATAGLDATGDAAAIRSGNINPNHQLETHAGSKRKSPEIGDGGEGNTMATKRQNGTIDSNQAQGSATAAPDAGDGTIGTT